MAVSVMLASYILQQRLCPYLRVDSAEQQAAVAPGLQTLVKRKVSLAVQRAHRLTVLDGGAQASFRHGGLSARQLRRQSTLVVASARVLCWRAVNRLGDALLGASIDYNVIESVFLIISVGLLRQLLVLMLSLLLSL